MVEISFAMSISVVRANGVRRQKKKKKKKEISDQAYAVKMRMQQKHLQYLAGSVLHWMIVEYLVGVNRVGGMNSVWVRERITSKSLMGTLTSFVVPSR